MPLSFTPAKHPQNQTNQRIQSTVPSGRPRRVGRRPAHRPHFLPPQDSHVRPLFGRPRWCPDNFMCVDYAYVLQGIQCHRCTHSFHSLLCVLYAAWRMSRYPSQLQLHTLLLLILLPSVAVAQCYSTAVCVGQVIHCRQGNRADESSSSPGGEGML